MTSHNEHDPIAVRRINEDYPVHYSGLGANVYADDRDYIDFRSGKWMTQVLGHVPQEWYAANQGAMGSDTEWRHECMDLLASILPPYLDKIVFYSSGSEAVDHALQLVDGPVCKLYGKQYHGNTKAILDLKERQFKSVCKGLLFTPFDGPTCQFVDALDEYELKQETGTIMICDEMQGFARTGRWWAHQWTKIKPDILVGGKGIGNGFPVAFVSARASIMDRDPDADLTSTFSGNPAAMQAVTNTINTIINDRLLDRASAIGSQLCETFNDWINEDIIGGYYGRGACMAFPCRNAKEVQEECYRNGLLLLPTENTIKVVPPLVIKADELEEGLSIIKSALCSTSGVAGTKDGRMTPEKAEGSE